ncbi:hypothetical protein DL990_33715 [Amycolatopsis sp. WAC 01416]|nr:hypothetical protein DL990_33715 [Amycolatopsis sp. WAC 01416]
MRGKAEVAGCESHFGNLEGCESGFRNVGGRGAVAKKGAFATPVPSRNPWSRCVRKPLSRHLSAPRPRAKPRDPTHLPYPSAVMRLCQDPDALGTGRGPSCTSNLASRKKRRRSLAGDPALSA